MVAYSKKLIIIGDSGVYGWGDTDGGGWCERLRRNFMSLPQAPVIYPLGIRGNGLEQIARRWEQEWVCRGELRRKVPDGLLLAIGLNDSAKVGRPDGRPQLSAEAFRFGIQQLLIEMKKQTQVMMIGLTPVDESVMPFADLLWYSNLAGAIYESQIEETCLDLDIPFLPMHKAMLTEPDYLKWIETDGIHLNSKGHEWVYKRIIKWKSLLDWSELQPLEMPTPMH